MNKRRAKKIRKREELAYELGIYPYRYIWKNIRKFNKEYSRYLSTRKFICVENEWGLKLKNDRN